MFVLLFQVPDSKGQEKDSEGTSTVASSPPSSAKEFQNANSSSEKENLTSAPPPSTTTCTCQSSNSNNSTNQATKEPQTTPTNTEQQNESLAASELSTLGTLYLTLTVFMPGLPINISLLCSRPAEIFQGKKCRSLRQNLCQKLSAHNF